MPNGWQIGDDGYAHYENMLFYDEVVESAKKYKKGALNRTTNDLFT